MKTILAIVLPFFLYGQASLQPGIIVSKEGTWVGGDHLYGLTNKIEIYVEIQKSESITQEIDKNAIKASIEKIFKDASLVPASDKSPPIPFYHMLILVAPVEKGFALLCEGRLFETVQLERFILDKDMLFQAITWEKQLIVVVPKDKLNEEVLKGVNEITSNFVKRYAFFEGIKTRQGLK